MLKSLLAKIEKSAGTLADRPCDVCLPAIIVNDFPEKPIYCERCGKERLVVVTTTPTMKMKRQISDAHAAPIR